MATLHWNGKQVAPGHAEVPRCAGLWLGQSGVNRAAGCPASPGEMGRC